MVSIISICTNRNSIKLTGIDSSLVVHVFIGGCIHGDVWDVIVNDVFLSRGAVKVIDGFDSDILNDLLEFSSLLLVIEIGLLQGRKILDVISFRLESFRDLGTLQDLVRQALFLSWRRLWSVHLQGLWISECSREVLKLVLVRLVGKALPIGSGFSSSSFSNDWVSKAASMDHLRLELIRFVNDLVLRRFFFSQQIF